MDLALNSLKGRYAKKTNQPTNQPTNYDDTEKWLSGEMFLLIGELSSHWSPCDVLEKIAHLTGAV